jgi:NTP pyrophosphatase (non-canonical NTP hydrolase)
MSKEYILYHIPGKKIGCTTDLYNRVTEQQGYEPGEYEVLEKSNDIDYISKRELQLQEEYGYRVDRVPYNKLNNNNNFNLKTMKINVTEQTTTFPCPINKLKGNDLHTPTIFDLIREWAEHRGIYDEGDQKTQYVKLMEEAGEVGRAILKDDLPEIKDGIGDMVVVLTNLAELSGLTIEECIESAYETIAKRKGKMINGTFVKNN